MALIDEILKKEEKAVEQLEQAKIKHAKKLNKEKAKIEQEFAQKLEAEQKKYESKLKKYRTKLENESTNDLEDLKRQLDAYTLGSKETSNLKKILLKEII